jgi:hypothetical protein
MEYAFCRTCWMHLYGEEAIARHAGHYVATSTWWRANEVRLAERKEPLVDVDLPEVDLDDLVF